MDATEARGVRLEWHPRERLALFRYAPHAQPTSEDAPGFQRWLDERIGEGAFVMLVDLHGAGDPEVAWRYRWLSWIWQRRARMRAAMINDQNVSPTVIAAFALAARVRVASFATEEEARAWLGLGRRAHGPAEPI